MILKRLNDKIKIYKDKHKKQLLLPNPKSEDPDTLTWDLSDTTQRKNFLSVRDNLWIEGYAVSANSGDTGLQLTYHPKKPLSGTLQDIVDTMIGTVVKIESIEVTCDKAENSPVTFTGDDFKKFQSDDDILADIKDTKYDGKHLLLYFEKVREITNYSPLKYGTKDFDINLKATISPNIIIPDYIKKQMKWKVSKWPENDTGSFDKDNELEVNFQNPKEGGLYKFEFKLWENGPKGYAIVLLRLAGPEIKKWFNKEIQLIDKYALLVRNKHKDKYPLGLYTFSILWHTREIGAVADWTGQAKGVNSPIRDLILRAQYTTHTLCGITIDNKKLSNIFIAYLVKSINPCLDDESARAFFDWKGTPGHSDDEYSNASYSAGFDLIRGMSIEEVMNRWGYYMQPPSSKSTHSRREWPCSEPISNIGDLRSYITELISKLSNN